MTFNIVAALLVSIVIGSAVMWRLCPRTGLGFADIMLVLFLGIGTGLGLCSLLLFVWLRYTNGNGKGEPIWAVLLAILLAGTAVVRWQVGQRQAIRSPNAPRGMAWLTTVFSLAVLSAIAGFTLLSLRTPHGGWDAWSVWNRDARFMFHGGEHWRDVLSTAEAGWTPGYPMLVPGAVAYCWFFVGKETVLASSAVGFLFTVAAVGLLVSSLFLLRSSSQGLIAGIVLVCSPQFIAQAATQYADVPLASFYLAAILLVCLYDSGRNHPAWLVMSGMMTGLAAWTKNEGLLFALVLVLVRCVVVGASRGVRAWARELLPFAMGLLPILMVVLYFKFRMVGPASDLAIQTAAGHDAMGKVLEQTPHAYLSRLVAFDRYVLILKYIVKQALEFGDWVVMLPPMLLMYLLVTGINEARKDRLAIYTGVLTLILMTGGYFMVYVITPHKLEWQLNFSLDRLLMQLWPLAIFTFFLLARTPEEAARGERADARIGV
jgi:4-amino-4-deoxy-L-arabinose transferase-like glycosyltransferase